MNIVQIAAFSRNPEGRFDADGPYNATKFRNHHLIPVLRLGPTQVILDGVEGYSAAWLEEAFGKIPEELKNNCLPVARFPAFEPYRRRILKYMYGNQDKSVPHVEPPKRDWKNFWLFGNLVVALFICGVVYFSPTWEERRLACIDSGGSWERLSGKSSQCVIRSKS